MNRAVEVGLEPPIVMHSPSASLAPFRTKDRSAARVLAWRYLLRDSRLGHVLYRGSGTSQTIEALTLHASSLHVLDTEASWLQLGERRPFDCICIEGLPGCELDAVITDLRPGGHFVLTLSQQDILSALLRPRSFLHALHFISPRACCRTLRRMGLYELRVFWCVPSQNLNVRFVELRRNSIAYFFSARQRSAKASAAAITVRALLRVGVPVPFANPFIVIGVKQ